MDVVSNTYMINLIKHASLSLRIHIITSMHHICKVHKINVFGYGPILFDFSKLMEKSRSI